MEKSTKGGSYNNIWYGLGRQRIQIPKPVLKSRVIENPILKSLYVASLGYYPKAEGHYTARKKGLHENFLFYCVDGAGWYKLGNKQYEVKTNEYFILPQNVAHSYGSSKHNPWTIYWVHFGGDILPSFNTLETVSHFKPVLIQNSNEILSCFAKIYKTLELGYSIDNLLFANMCLSNYLTLFVYNAKHSVDTHTDKTSCVDRAILYMQERINENITLNEISNHFNYSTSRFSSLFKQKTGYAPIDYFIQMKMQKATQQLDLTDKSIKDIGISMGFEDPYYFSRRFSKVIGLSPSKYRSIKKD